MHAWMTFQKDGRRARHVISPFPSREALVEAVYRTEVEKLAAAERNFAESMRPIDALRAWMLLFVDYIATKKIIAPALNALVGDPKKAVEASYTQVWGAIRALVKRAVKSGDIYKDLDPIDLLRALIGVSNVSTSPDWQQSAKKSISLSLVRGQPNYALPLVRCAESFHLPYAWAI